MGAAGRRRSGPVLPLWASRPATLTVLPLCEVLAEIALQARGPGGRKYLASGRSAPAAFLRSQPPLSLDKVLKPPRAHFYLCKSCRLGRGQCGGGEAVPRSPI